MTSSGWPSTTPATMCSGPATTNVSWAPSTKPPSAACPLTDVIEDQTRAALDGLVEGFTINWVWMPPWGPDKITDDGREMLRALGFNV